MVLQLPSLIPQDIFRAYDIRGIVGDTLTPGLVYGIGRAFGTQAQLQGQCQVIVARDGRLSGPELLHALCEGLLDTGLDVIDIGAVPTPLLYFAANRLNSQSGIMLTGSHNPPEYNGLKMVLAGETLAEESIQQLYRRLVAKDFVSGRGQLSRQDMVADYIETIVKDIKVKRRLRVVVDAGSGIAGAVAPNLLQALGCEVIPLFCEVDGHFPHHHPDPSQAANLTALIETVAQHKADLGIAFDGDGDRLGVVTEQGEIIWPDRQLMLYAKDVLSRNPGATILYDVKCTRHLAKVIQQYGGQPLMWKTGHSLVKAKMRETGALLGGEMSGHTFFKERWFGFDDGLYTAVRLIEILAADSKAISTIFAELPDSINTPELKLPIAESEKFGFMQRFQEQAQFPEAMITTIDGLRADFADGWGLIRPSNTTPCLVLRFEADTAAGLADIQSQFRQQLLGLAPELQLPF